MNALEIIEIAESIKISIYPDADCPDPIKDYMEGVERWEIGSRRTIAENYTSDEDTFYLALAQQVYTDFPDYLEGSDHAEKIAKKYFAISSDVGGQSATVYLVALKSDLISIYGCPDPQKCIESDAEVYSVWADGDCVGYVTTVDGEQTDSCWGFYSSRDAIESAKANLPTIDDQYHFDRAEN